MDDLTLASHIIIYCIASCMGVIMVYLLLMQQNPIPFVSISMVTIGVGVIALTLFVSNYRNEINEKYTLDESYFKGTIAMIWVALIIYFSCIFNYIKDIRIAGRILSTASTIIVKNSYMIPVAFVSAGFLIIWIVYWLYCFIYLISTGEIEQPSHGRQIKNITHDLGT